MDWDALNSSEDAQIIETKLWALDIASEISESGLSDLKTVAASLLKIGSKFEDKHSIVLRVWNLLHDIEVLCEGIESSKVRDALLMFYSTLKLHNDNADVVASSCELLCMLAGKNMLSGGDIDDKFLNAVIGELSSHAHSNPVKRATLSILLTLTRQGHKHIYDEKKILSELLPVLMDILLVNRAEHDIVEAAGIIVYHAMTSKESGLVKAYYNNLVTAVSTILSFEPLPPLSALVPCILMLDIILDGAYDDGHLLEAIPCMIESGLEVIRILVEHLAAVKSGDKDEGDTEELANHQVCSTLCSALKIINLAVSDADILVLGIDEEDMKGHLEGIRSYLLKHFPVASAAEVLKSFPGDSFFIERSASWFAEELATFRGRADGLIGAIEDAHDAELVSDILHQEEGIEQKLHALIAKLDESTGDASAEVAAAAQEAKEEAEEEQRKQEERLEKARQERERKAKEALERRARQEKEREQQRREQERAEKEEQLRLERERKGKEREKEKKRKEKEEARKLREKQGRQEREELKAKLESERREREKREEMERVEKKRERARRQEEEQERQKEERERRAQAEALVEAQAQLREEHRALEKAQEQSQLEHQARAQAEEKAASLSSALDSSREGMSEASILALVRCSRATQEQAHAAVQRADLLQGLFIEAARRLEQLSRENQELHAQLRLRQGRGSTPRKQSGSPVTAAGPEAVAGSPFAVDVSRVQGGGRSPGPGTPGLPPSPPLQPARFITDGVLTPHGTRALEERQLSLAMGGALKGLQDAAQSTGKGAPHSSPAPRTVPSKEALTGVATSILRLFELMNSQVPSERGSYESVAASTVRKYLGMGVFGKPQPQAQAQTQTQTQTQTQAQAPSGGLTLREVDIVLSSVGVKQVSVFGVAYVLVRCASKVRGAPVSDAPLVEAIRSRIDAFVESHSKPVPVKNRLAPLVDLNEASTADLHSLRRLLERQTSALLTIFNAYKATSSTNAPHPEGAGGVGEVISVDGTARFALDIGLIPTVISRAQFLDILKRSRVLDVDEEPGGAEEVTQDQFKRLLINLALCVPTFASASAGGIDKSRMTATILVSNFLLWMRRRASAWHRKVEQRVSSRGAVNIPILSFNMSHIRDSSSSVREDDEAERRRLLAALCGAQHEVRRIFV